MAEKQAPISAKFDQVEFDKVVKNLIKEYKADKQINEDALQKALVQPMRLNADQIDELYEKIESAGISVVDETASQPHVRLKTRRQSCQKRN